MKKVLSFMLAVAIFATVISLGMLNVSAATATTEMGKEAEESLYETIPEAPVKSETEKGFISALRNSIMSVVHEVKELINDVRSAEKLTTKITNYVYGFLEDLRGATPSISIK